ncbi:hypothetical protein [Sunxiuqinia indica]|nr:hypothetical protein [Sunxiuqinia indica]
MEQLLHPFKRQRIIVLTDGIISIPYGIVLLTDGIIDIFERRIIIP